MTTPIAAMNLLAPVIESALPKGAHFALIVFADDGTGQGGHYIANAERSSVIAAIRETADRLESRAPTEHAN